MHHFRVRDLSTASPCSQMIVAVAGYDKKYHTAPMISRGDWKSEYNYAGHR